MISNLSRGENEGFIMKDNIIFRKIWQDDDVMELTVECSSPIITATSEIYVSDSLIDELISEITRFRNGNKEGFWANEERGRRFYSVRIFSLLSRRCAGAYRDRSVCGAGRWWRLQQAQLLFFRSDRIRFAHELL